MATERQKTQNRATRAKPGEADVPDQVIEKRSEYLTARQLADLLQISESTIHRLRREGRIPAVMLTERLIRFNLRDVQRALRPVQSARTQPDGGNEANQGPSPQLSFDDLYSGFSD